MKAIHEALETMLPVFDPRGPVRRPIEQAQGLVLAQDVTARAPSPPFDNSAMDGYAVRARDIEGARAEQPTVLPLRGESRAGGPTPEPLREGTAMRILTGAPLPEGADTVVMQEDTGDDGETVRIGRHPGEGANIRRSGEDLPGGETMLARGSTLGPGEIGLLASQRYAAVRVHRRPRVAILATGDELRDPSDPPEAGTIVDSNTYALAAQVQQAGGEPWVLARAPDALDAITERVREGLRADVLLTIGGVSVGAYDYVHAAFERVGVEPAFWKVAIKPGKPLAFARAGEVPVVGLPGNPVSAMVTFEVFVRPGLRRMLGDPAPHPAPLPVEPSAPYRHKPGRTELARARLRRDGPRWIADLHPRQGSGALPSMVDVDALVIVPSDQREVTPGEQLEAIPLGTRRGARTSPFAS